MPACLLWICVPDGNWVTIWSVNMALLVSCWVVLGYSFRFSSAWVSGRTSCAGVTDSKGITLGTFIRLLVKLLSLLLAADLDSRLVFPVRIFVLLWWFLATNFFRGIKPPRLTLSCGTTTPEEDLVLFFVAIALAIFTYSSVMRWLHTINCELWSSCWVATPFLPFLMPDYCC